MHIYVHRDPHYIGTYMGTPHTYVYIGTPLHMHIHGGSITHMYRQDPHYTHVYQGIPSSADAYGDSIKYVQELHHMCVYGSPTICVHEGPIKHIYTGTSS